MNALLVALILGTVIGFAARGFIAAVVEMVVRAFHVAVRIGQVALVAGGLILVVRVVT